MRSTVLRAAVTGLLVLTGLSAVWGGYMLVVGAWEMDPEWLVHTPFETWTVPGLATAAFPGLAVLLAGVAVLVGRPHHREVAVAAGVGLMAWVGVELVWLQVFHPVMHPLVLAIGLAVAVLASRLPGEKPAAPRIPSVRAPAHP